MVNRRILIKLNWWTKLTSFYHLTNLFIANKLFINFFQFLFKHKILRVFQYLLTVHLYYRLPDFFIETELNFFTWIFIKALKVSFINVDSRGWNWAIKKVVFDLRCDILTVYNFVGFFFSIFKILILITPYDIIRWHKKWEFISNLLVVTNFNNLMWEKQDRRISHKRCIFSFDRRQKLKHRARVITIINRLILLIIFLISHNPISDTTKLSWNQLWPFLPV